MKRTAGAQPQSLSSAGAAYQLERNLDTGQSQHPEGRLSIGRMYKSGGKRQAARRARLLLRGRHSGRKII